MSTLMNEIKEEVKSNSHRNSHKLPTFIISNGDKSNKHAKSTVYTSSDSNDEDESESTHETQEEKKEDQSEAKRTSFGLFVQTKLRSRSDLSIQPIIDPAAKVQPVISLAEADRSPYRRRSARAYTLKDSLDSVFRASQIFNLREHLAKVKNLKLIIHAYDMLLNYSNSILMYDQVTKALGSIYEEARDQINYWLHKFSEWTRETETQTFRNISLNLLRAYRVNVSPFRYVSNNINNSVKA